MKASLIPLVSFAVASAAFGPSEIRNAPIRSHSSTTRTHMVKDGDNAFLSDEANESRRNFLATAVATVAGAVITKPSVSNAVYGADANIMIPDIVQGMSDRTNKQCLVESLGNRECLVYLDPENQLYKGSDAKLQFERLGSCLIALKDVEAYIESKQWNKVQGVLTGPMGTLSSTMNELTKDDTNGAKKLSVDIRKDLYAIAGAADRKNGKEAMSAYAKAVEKLDKFVTLVSSS